MPRHEHRNVESFSQSVRESLKQTFREPSRYIRLTWLTWTTLALVSTPGGP